VGFVVDKTLLWQAFFDRILIPLQFAAPTMLCTHLSSEATTHGKPFRGRRTTGLSQPKPKAYFTFFYVMALGVPSSAAALPAGIIRC
jgi:hypothetical protein